MKTRRFPTTVSLGLFVLILALLGVQTATWGQAMPAAVAASPVGTAFTYQGQLQSGGTPVDDNCDFSFSLWDAASTGNQVGSSQPALNIPVIGGLFAVELDFGDEAFAGEARWLQTAVRCPAGGGTYTTLAPRQALNPVPYAMQSQDLRLPLEKVMSSPDTAFNVMNFGDGSAISAYTNGSGGAIDGATGGSGTAVSAYSGGTGIALLARQDGSGQALNVMVGNEGTNHAVDIAITNPDNTASLINAQTNGLGLGADFRIDNPLNDMSALQASTNGSGRAAYFNSSGSGEAIAVWSFGSGPLATFQNEGSGGGVRIKNNNPDTTEWLIDASTVGLGGGANFRIDNPLNDMPALQATTNGSGDSLKVDAYGSGAAIDAWAHGSGRTIQAFSDGTEDLAKLQINNPDNTANIINAQTNGLGVGADIRIRNPLNTHSVLHITTDGSGWAGSFGNEGTGGGVRIESAAGTEGLSVVGGSKNAVVPTSEGMRLLYTEESSQVWFTDHGFGRLAGGSVFVAIDPLFAETVNLEEPYHVFVQAYGDAELYVSQRTPEGFEVRLRAGDPDVEFSYRLVVTRRGYEGKRLEPAAWADDDPNLNPAQPAASENGGAE
jgi:hypothetical protein